MQPETATLVSYICLVLISCYCLQVHFFSRDSEFGTISYIIMVVCAVLGAWRTYDASKMPEAVAEAQKQIELFADGFVLSYSAAEMWGRERIRIEIVYLQLIVPLIPIAMHIANKDFKSALHYVILGSVISFVAASILCGCFYGIFAASIYAANLYYVKDNTIMEMVPPSDMKNYVACLFSLFLLYTLEYD